MKWLDSLLEFIFVVRYHYKFYWCCLSSLSLGLYDIIKHTVEAPVKIDHTKCEDLVFAYGRRTLKRIELQRSLPRNFPCTSTFWKRISCMQFLKLWYTVCSYMWPPRVLRIHWVAQHIQQTQRSDHVSSVRFQGVKNNGNLKKELIIYERFQLQDFD